MNALDFRRIILFVQNMINRLPFCEQIENWAVKQHKGYRHDNDSGPIFIIGSPRSGSTLLFQLLLNRFHLSYISNAASLFYSCPAAATAAIFRFFDAYRTNRMESNYGYVNGLVSPSEAGPLITKWFGDEKDLVDRADAHQRVNQAKKSIKRISELMSGPFILKSLKLSLKIEAIASAFPNAVFVHIQREPVYVIQSILLTRRSLFGDDRQWWSYRLPNHDDLIHLQPLEQIARQIKTIEEIIYQSEQRVGSTKFVHVSYETLCRFPEATLRKIESRCHSNGIALEKKRSATPCLKPSKRIHLPTDEWHQLNCIVSKIFAS